MTEQNLPSRRAILTTGLIAATSGCIGPFSNGPDCDLSSDLGEEEPHIYMIDISNTSNNVEKGGSCSRWTAKRCFQTTLWIDQDMVSRIEAQTPSGEVVAVWDATNTSRSEQSPTSDSKETPPTSGGIFEGVTETPSADNPSFGPDVPDTALGVYLELAALSKGETAKRSILLFHEGKQIEQMSATLDCS